MQAFPGEKFLIFWFGLASVGLVGMLAPGRSCTCWLLQKGSQQIEHIWKGRHKLIHHLTSPLRPHCWPVASRLLQGTSVTFLHELFQQ